MTDNGEQKKGDQETAIQEIGGQRVGAAASQSLHGAGNQEAGDKGRGMKEAGDKAGGPRACVIGWPISHSRSPLIHRFWLKQYAIDGGYDKQAVRPEDLPEFLSSLAARGLSGCNVTVPHKQAAFALADVREPSAEAVGAANTLWLQGDKLHAANTDGIGFMMHLRQNAPHWHDIDGPVSVLGAGGAACALVYALLDAGVSKLRLFNRTIERAEALANRFNDEFAGRIDVIPWQARAAASSDVILLVNATSLGMTGSAPLEMDLSALNDNAVIADIVYAPLETDLLARARLRGLKTVDGLGMLLHQAAPGFEKWFGRRPQVTDELRDLIVADILAA